MTVCFLGNCWRFGSVQKTVVSIMTLVLEVLDECATSNMHSP
jgi:hypothetical protein